MHERNGRKSCPQSERRNNSRTRAKRTTKRLVGLCAGILLSLAQRARSDGRWQDSIREEMWPEVWLTINSFRNIVVQRKQMKTTWVWKENAERNHNNRRVLRVVRKWVRRLGDRQWRFAKIRCHRNSRQQCHTSRSIRKRRVRISACKRTSKNSSLQIHDPIGIRRRNETTSDKHTVSEHITNDLWTEAKGATLSLRSWIPDFTCKKRRIQVGEWKTHENPKGHPDQTACG